MSSREGDPTDAPPCDDVVIAATSGLPLERVAIEAWPTSFDESSYIAVVDPETGATGVAPVRVAGDDVWFVAPIHPASFIDGGDVELTFVHDDVRCGPFTFTVDPLPEAPGAFAAAWTSFRAVLDAWATANGTIPDAWVTGDPSTLAPIDVGFALAHDLTSNNGNANSIPHVLDGTAPVIGGEGVDVDVLDRITARTGLRSHFDDVARAISELPEFRSTARLAGVCIDVPDAPTLDGYMEVAKIGQFESTGATADVVEGTGAAIGMLGAVTPNPVVKFAGIAIGNLTSGYLRTAEAMAGLFPSTLTSLDFFAFPTQFNEDDPGPGEWSEVFVEAASTGWAADKAVLDAILSRAQMKATFALAFAENDAVGRGLAVSASSALGNALIGDSDTDVLEFGPCSWVVDVTGDEWTKSVVTGDAIEADDPSRSYEPKRAGESLLRIETRTDRFGNGFAASSVLIRVQAIEVEVTPPVVVVEPGDIVLYQAIVQNANDETLDWSASVGTVDDFGDLSASYETPLDRTLYPITITATSLAEGGARDHPSAPVRRGFATIQLEPETAYGIVPNGVCVEVGEPIEFAVVASDGDPPAVTWSVSPSSAGAFTGNTFVAQNEGDATITGTSLDPDLTLEASISIDECQCSWSVVTAGGLSGLWQGEVIEWSNIPGLTTFLFREQVDLGPVFPNGLIRLEHVLEDGETGTYPAVGFFIASKTEAIETVEETASLLVTIRRNQNGLVQGSVIGPMVVNEPDGAPVTYSMSFIARTPTIEDPQPCRNDP